MTSEAVVLLILDHISVMVTFLLPVIAITIILKIIFDLIFDLIYNLTGRRG